MALGIAVAIVAAAVFAAIYVMRRRRSRAPSWRRAYDETFGADPGTKRDRDLD